MSHLELHRDFYDKPIRLTEEEIASPLQVIARFFNEFTLSEVREIHHDLEVAGLSSDIVPFEDGERRYKQFLYNEMEERMIEAAFLLTENHSPSAPSLPPHSIAEAPKSIFDLQNIHELLKKGTSIIRNVSAINRNAFQIWFGSLDFRQKNLMDNTDITDEKLKTSINLYLDTLEEENDKQIRAINALAKQVNEFMQAIVEEQKRSIAK